MNSATLVGKVEVVSTKEMGQGAKTWINCGIKIKNDKGLDLWFDVRGVNKAGKEMEWLPKLKDKYLFVDGRLTSYQNKEDQTVYGISASKGGLHRISESDVDYLTETGHGGIARLSGKIESVKSNPNGDYFIKVGIRYMKPKDNDFGYYYTRIQCPKDFQPEQFGEGSYITVFGYVSMGPDKKPLVKAVCVA